MFYLIVNTICFGAVALGVVGLIYGWVIHSTRPIILRTLDVEIVRAERAERSVGFMLLQLNIPISGKLLSILPGQTLAIQTFGKTLRNTDLIKKFGYTVYSVLLTEMPDESGVAMIKKRVLEEAKSQGWQNLKIGIATFPANGDTGKDLYKAAKTDGNITSIRFFNH